DKRDDSKRREKQEKVRMGGEMIEPTCVLELPDHHRRGGDERQREQPIDEGDENASTEQHVCSVPSFMSMLARHAGGNRLGISRVQRTHSPASPNSLGTRPATSSQATAWYGRLKLP